MDFRLSDEQEARKKEFNQVCKELAKKRPPEYLSWESIFENEASWQYDRVCAKEFARRGWLSLSWPEEYGGKGTMMDRVLLAEARGYHGVPGVDVFGVSMLAPTLLQAASEAIKREFLPPIAAAEAVWCELWSEPNAGSDLASLTCSATRNGDHYVINGQKIWTSGAHLANWGFGVFKTDAQAAQRHNLSFLLFDMKTPGITIRPIRFMNGERIYNEVYFDDVRIPTWNIVGKENDGWSVVNLLAGFERSHIDDIMSLVRELEELVAYCNQAGRNGQYLSEDPIIRDRLAEVACDLQAARALAYRVADLQNRNEMSLMDAAALKVFASELGERFASYATDILGPYGLVKCSKWARLKGVWEKKYQECFVFSIAMGTNEIQKNIIAWQGLGLTRMR